MQLDQVKALVTGGVSGLGLTRFDPATGQFQHFYPDKEDPHGLTLKNITAITQDYLGHLWLGYFNGGLNRFDGKTFVNYPYYQDHKDHKDQKGHTNFHLRGIVEDHQRKLR